MAGRNELVKLTCKLLVGVEVQSSYVIEGHSKSTLQQFYSVLSLNTMPAHFSGTLLIAYIFI